MNITVPQINPATWAPTVVELLLDADGPIKIDDTLSTLPDAALVELLPVGDSDRLMRFRCVGSGQTTATLACKSFSGAPIPALFVLAITITPPAEADSVSAHIVSVS